ncbi:MAG: hypothetical protein K2I23_07715, partial [Clostridia bacterium]|nr:hypothetical protein [Clostridia bacterium]
HSNATGTINGGEIYNNSCNYDGAGFQIHASSKLTMNGGKLYNNTSGGTGAALWINSSSSFIMTGGIITGNRGNSGNVIYLSGSSVTLSGSAQLYGNYLGANPQDITSRFTVGGPFTSAHIGISMSGTFTSGYSTHNSGVSASKYCYYTANNTSRVGDTVASLGSGNEGTIVSGAPTGKIVWKYQFSGETTWKSVASAVANEDKFAEYSSESYLTLTNPSKKIIVAPFASADATTPLAPMTDLVRKTSNGVTDFKVCSPSVLDYESGLFHFRYNGNENYVNATLTLEMNFSVIYVDVEALEIRYDGKYKKGILFNSDYLEYELISAPSDASEVKRVDDSLEFLSTGNYKIKLKFKDEFAEQITEGLVGWADTEWTEPLQNIKEIEIDFTVKKGLLALPSEETAIYDSSAWTLNKAEGEWCSEAHKDSSIVSMVSAEYKNFASSATYSQVDDLTQMINAGYYRITVKVVDTHNYSWSDGALGEKTFSLNVNKAKIEMNQPDVDDYGLLVDGAPITAVKGVKPIDNDTMAADGVYGLEYVPKADVANDSAWVRSAPTTAGEYYVRPYITSPDNSNYEIDYIIDGDGIGACYTLFERLKNSIAIPYLWKDGAIIDSLNSTTTSPYTGVAQVFELVNGIKDGAHFLSDGIVVDNSGGTVPIGTNSFSVTNMQTYTLTVSLADPANNRWATGEKDNTDPKTVTLIISKAYLYVSFEYNDEEDFVEGSTFEKGEHETLTILVGELLSSSKVELEITYTGGVVADSNIKTEDNYVKTDIDLMALPIGTYNFTITLKESVKNYTLVKDNSGEIVEVTDYSFKFTILEARIIIADTSWKYENQYVNHGVAQPIEGEVPELLFNKSDYVFSVDNVLGADGKKITNIAGLKFDYTVTDTTGREI